MKKILLSIALLATTTGAALQPAAAQKNENRMSIRVAGYEVALEGKQQRRNTRNGWREWTYQGHIGTLEAGFNNFRTWGDSYWAYSPEENCFMELDRASSLHITVNAATFSAGFARNWIGISMALGLSYDQYALDTPVAFEKVGRKLYTYTPDAPLKSSKMRSLSLHVPLVLEINPARNFFISAGGYADVTLWSDAVWKWPRRERHDGKRRSPKDKLSSPYSNFLEFGLTARLGFDDVYLFGNYALSEHFQSGRGPRLNPYTLGIGFDF